MLSKHYVGQKILLLIISFFSPPLTYKQICSHPPGANYGPKTTIWANSLGAINLGCLNTQYTFSESREMLICGMLILHILSQCIHKFEQKNQKRKDQTVFEDLELEILSNPAIKIITIDNHTKWKIPFFLTKRKDKHLW